MDIGKYPRKTIEASQAKAAAIDGGSTAPDAFAKFDKLMAATAPAAYNVTDGDAVFKRWPLHSPQRIMVMISGVKGGPGKSTTTMCFVDALLENGFAFLVIDADQKTKDVGPACKGEKNLRVTGLKLDSRAGIQGLITIFKETQISPIVVNFPAGLTSPFEEFAPPLRLALKEFDYQLVVLYVLSPLHESVQQLDALMDQMPNAIVHTVLNLKEAPTNQLSDFSYYLNHPVRRRVEAQGRTLVMQTGPRAAMNLMESQKRSYRRIANDPATDYMDRTELETFLDNMGCQFERAFEFRRPI